MREKGSCVVMGPSVIFLHKYSTVFVYRVIHEKMM